LPRVSAMSWAVIDGNTGKLLFGKQEQQRREIASLTKIMTCLTVLQLSDVLALDIHVTKVNIEQGVDEIIGTSANLKPGDRLTVWELLHGLMLPSGNDAAY